MADNLTRQLQEELKKRGRTASLTQIDDALKTLSGQSAPSPSAVSGGLFGPGPLPEHVQQAEIREPSGSALNAVGAALWSFADTAAFGIPGALVDEEEFIDFEDPAAKWTSAIGGFAGFVAGAPMKVGAKATQLVAKRFIQKGMKLADEVVEQMVKRGKSKGLSDNTIKEVTTGYRSIVSQSQLNKNLRGEEFIQKSEDFLSQYLARAEQVGDLTAREINAVKNMFGPGLRQRPIQDWYGIMAERGIFKTNPKAAKVLAHTINDSIMFGVIDTVFEGVLTTLDPDHDFDWTAPMWGVGTGAAFGQLGWLKPRGNMASWKKDFMHGARAAFGRKDIYKNLNSKQLEASAQFWGESLSKSERLHPRTGQKLSHLVDISYGGKKVTAVDLTKGDVLGQIRSTFGADSQEALRSFMESSKKEWGKELMRWANKEAVGNLAEVWPRMLAGGALFNLHSYYDMAFKGVELGVHELLPHFLIGAYVQRHSNPATYDMSTREINKVRGNLMRLGMGPGQFNEIPTLKYRDTVLNSPFKSTEWNPVVDKARDLGIISSSPEIIEKPLERGEQSVALPQNRSRKFEVVYEKLVNHGEESMSRQLEQISVKEANDIMESIYKIKPELRKGTAEDILKAFDKATLAATKDFEQEFTDVAETIRTLDATIIEGESQLMMTAFGDKDNPGRVPDRVNVSEDLKKRVMEGNFKDAAGNAILVDAEGTPLKGQKAAEALNERIASLNSVLTTVQLIGSRQQQPSKGKRTRVIQTESLLSGVVETIDKFEDGINAKYPDNRHMSDRFSFHGSFGDYIHILSRNVAIRSAERVAKIFSTRNEPSERGELAGILSEVDLLIHGPNDAEGAIRRDITNLKFKESTFEGQEMSIPEARRILSRVLTIQAASGGYKMASEGERSVKEVTFDDVSALQKFLSDKGFRIRPSLQRDWMHNQIIDYIVGERVANSRLSLDQTDALFELADVGLVNFEAAVEGGPAGFTIKKVNLEVLKPDSPMYERGQEYNRWADKALEDGKRYPTDTEGLITVETGKIIPTDESYMRLVDGIINKSPGKYVDATQALTQFIAALPSEGKSYETLQNQIQVFTNASPENTSRLVKWLQAAKVMSKPGVGAGNWKINQKTFLKKIEQVSEELIYNMEKFGVDQKYAEEIYSKQEQAVKDRLLNDVHERDKSNNITLQKFWERYRWEDPNNDYSKYESKKMSEAFQDVIYQNNADPNAKVKVLDTQIFKKFIAGVHVKDENGNWGRLIRTKGKENLVPRALRDFITLLATQHRQTPKRQITFDRRKLSFDKDIHQKTRMEAVLDTIGIDYYIINAMAPVVEDVQGRYTRIRHVDIFSGDSQNVDTSSGGYADQVKSHRRHFQSLLSGVKGELPNGEQMFTDKQGIEIMRLGNGIDAIGIEKGHFKNLFQPFKALYEQYKNNKEISEKELGNWKSIVDKIDSIEAGEKNADGKDFIIHGWDAELMLHRLIHSEMLTGFDKGKFDNRMFVDFLNGTNQEKISSRIKLFHTKKFIRYDKEFVKDLADIYKEVEDMHHGRKVGQFGVGVRGIPSGKKASNALKRIVANDGFGVLIWNDTEYNTVRQDTEKVIQRVLGKDYENWKWEDMMGKAHQGTSAFDSIAFVSERTMIAAHALMGHNPSSRNPIKPVISSGGKDRPLLLGKTLLVYTPELDTFFRNNNKADILLTHSGAKVYNPNLITNLTDGKKVDRSMINRSWDYISGKGKTGVYYGVGEGRLRKIGIDALGLKPEEDKPYKSAPISQSDFNYANNFESDRLFRSLYESQLNTNLNYMHDMALEPIAMRQFILSEAARDGLVPNIDAGNQSLNAINNMVHFATYTRDANPLRYSENMAKGKLYSMYINSLVNGKRSVFNQFDADNSHRFGGNSIIIQSARGRDRLRPTLVDKQGNMIMRGQVMLGNHEKNMGLSELTQNGYELRIVKNKGVDVLNINDFVAEQADLFKVPEKLRESFIEGDLDIFNNGTLGQLHATLEQVNSRIGTDYEIGVIVNRKPRTRPNDMTILGLKGFLERDYGNSIQLSSLDVVNVFEGDYDVDKADYFFAHKKEMYDHVQRTQQFFVNGVDPSDYKIGSEVKVGLAPSLDRDYRWQMYADNEQFTKNIGSVQKVPRALGHLEKIGEIVTEPDIFVDHITRKGERTTKVVRDGVETEVVYQPKLLLSKQSGEKGATETSRIFLDYEHANFFQRSALETQYIIDGTGKLNPNIADNLRRWRDDFLFPSMTDNKTGQKSVTADAVRDYGFGERMRNNPKQSQRVRIFRKVVLDVETGKTKEVDLTRLEKAILKEMIGQYNTFLNATGKTLWENSGDQRQPRWDDVLQTANKWGGFLSDISNSVYYNLRHRRIDPTKEEGKTWKEDDDFNRYFKVTPGEYQKIQEGKRIKKKYWKPRQSIFRQSVEDNAGEIAKGSQGAVIDRIIMNLKERDPFEELQVKGLGGTSTKLMDSWYQQLMTGEAKDVSEAMDRFSLEITQGKWSHDKKVKLIGSLKKKIMDIGNSKLPWKTRDASKQKVNELINKLESEIAPELIPDEYKKTKKYKDLKAGLINFKWIGEGDLKEGSIQYAAIDNLQQFLPYGGRLGAGAKAYLKEILAIRKQFYSNQDTLGDIRKHGNKTIQDSRALEYQTGNPDLTTFYEVEHRYLMKGLSEYGPQFILAYMKPAQDKNTIGVHNGRVVSVPYSKSARYKRGLQFLTRVAEEESTIPDIIDLKRGVDLGGMGEFAQDMIRMNMRNLQTMEAQFDRFFNNKFDMMNLISTNLAETGKDVYDVGGIRSLVLGDVRLPNLHKDIEKGLTSFSRIKWSRDRTRISEGFNTMNDHLIDLYSDIARVSGQEVEFKQYLDGMNEINAQLMSNKIINPMDYLALRANLDKEMRTLAQDVLTNPETMNQNNVHVKNIKSNPVYALMGGGQYFRGASLEKTGTLSHKRLKTVQDMFNTLNEYRDNVNHKSEQTRREFVDDILSRRKAGEC